MIYRRINSWMVLKKIIYTFTRDLKSDITPRVYEDVIHLATKLVKVKWVCYSCINCMVFSEYLHLPRSRTPILTTLSSKVIYIHSATALVSVKGKVGSLPSHQLLWFLASITSTRDSKPDLPAPHPVALPLGHRVGW